MSTMTIVDDPPQPASGDGDVIVDVEGTQVVLTWRHGQLVDVNTANDDDMMLEGQVLKAAPAGTSSPTCIKCISTGPGMEIICWVVPC